MKNKYGFTDIVFDIFNYLCLIFFTLICILPFYYIFINTISDNTLVSSGQIMLIPKGIHLENYLKIMKMKALPHALFITLARTVLGTISSVLCTAFVAYIVTKKDLWQRKFIYRFFIVTMYFNAGLVPHYLNVKFLHLDNTFIVYIIGGVISAFNLVLVKTFIESIPESIEESMEIDGAGCFVIFFRMILPLSMPILATVAVFNAVEQWNSFMDTLLYIRDSNLYTLQYLLWQYLNQATMLAESMKNSSLNAGFNLATVLNTTTVRMTITMVVTLPVLFVYPFFQRYFVKGIILGAVKG
jgi:ABC-type glycerol-3-phosphate transport system permease component